MDRIAVFGIGSTNFRYAVATPTGDFLTDVRVEPTRPRELGDQILDAIDGLVADSPGELSAVSVSAPGLVDRTSGTIRKFDTADGNSVDEVTVESLVEAEFGLPVYLDNDCNASALGEWHFGSNSEFDSVAHVTFGTGVGGGVVEAGQLIRGEDGQAGEFGLIPVASESDRESSGVTGAWEAFCSGRGIPQFAESLLDDQDPDSTLAGRSAFTAQDVFVAAEDGDQFALDCLDHIARYNAVGIAAITNTFNPGLITVGGGVALNNESRVLDGIERYLDDYVFVDEPVIRTSRLGDDIGLYGALATYLDGSPDADATWERSIAERPERVTD